MTGTPSRRSERLAGEVDVDPSRERERHHERRGGEVAGARQRMDAALEVPVARQDRHRGDSFASIASATGSASGPEFPMQVVQP